MTNIDPDSDSARIARHRALHNIGLPPHPEAMQRDEIIASAVLELSAALGGIDAIRMDKETEVSYETMQRSGFNRKTGWRRNYTLKDARIDAKTAAIHLRNAWDMLDPMNYESQSAALKAAKQGSENHHLALLNSQLQTAIGHLHTLLDVRRTANQAWDSERAAREWLESIGSEAP